MTEPSDLVTAFVREWDAPSLDAAKIRAYFTDDAVYHNIPFKPMTGGDTIAKALGAGMGMESAGWEIIHQVANGNVVMNERVDRFTKDGRKLEIPVVGVFEIRDGKIAAWRDYFDVAMFNKQMNPES